VTEAGGEIIEVAASGLFDDLKGLFRGPVALGSDDVAADAAKDVTANSGRYADRLTGDASGADWLAHRQSVRAEMERRFDSAFGSGIDSEKLVNRGRNSITHIVTFKDGTIWVRKRMLSGFEDIATDTDYVFETVLRHADAEELTSYVSDALRSGAPQVIRTGPAEIYMPFVKGVVAEDVPDPYRFAYNFPNTLVESDQGLRIGMVQSLVGNPDLNDGNWVVGANPDGLLAHFDHAWATYARHGTDPATIGGTQSMFLSRMPERLSSLPADEWAGIERNLQALKPVFEAQGRPDWHENMMINFDYLRSMART
jgi:hypothetical protein